MGICVGKINLFLRDYDFRTGYSDHWFFYLGRFPRDQKLILGRILRKGFMNHKAFYNYFSRFVSESSEILALEINLCTVSLRLAKDEI